MQATSSPVISRSVLLRTRNGVFLTFFLCGFMLASWAGRIPLVMTMLGINTSQMGILLLCLAAGSIIALILAGWITTRFANAVTLCGGGGLFSGGLLMTGLAIHAGSYPLAGAGLFVAGLGFSAVDVAMNLEGARVERLMKRTIMPRLHAFFSLGTVAGALLAAGLQFVSIPFTAPFLTLALLTLGGLIACSRHYLPAEYTRAATANDSPAGEKANPFAAWLEPRTLLIGFIVLTASLVEGAAFDWLALGVVTGFGSGADAPAEWLGSLSLALFVTGMTGMRWFGGALIDRYGRVAILRLCMLLGITGLLIFGLAPYYHFAIAGIICWGLGSALAFPMGMSAASDEPSNAGARIAVVAALGYCSMLAGPPVLGFIAHATGVRSALLMLVFPLMLSFFLLPVMRPPVKKPPENGTLSAQSGAGTCRGQAD